MPRHILIAVSGSLGRIASALIQLASVNLLLSSLGIDGYAVFVLLTGLQGWFLLADLGIGASAQNHISEARANGGATESILLYGRLFAVALLIVTVYLLHSLAPLIAPALLRSFTWLSDQDKTDLFFVTGTLSIGIGIGGVVYKIWYAEQRGYWANVVPALASTVGLFGLWFADLIPAEYRLMYALVAFIGPTAALPLAIMAVQLVQSRRVGIFAGPATVGHRAPMAAIAKRGLAFWAFALLGTMTLQIDYIVMSQFLSALDITTYALATKVFGLAFFIYNALLMALWPVFTELLARQDGAQVRRLLSRYLTLGITYMLITTFAMLWLMPAAISLLAPGRGLVVSAGLILLIGAYQIVRIWTDTYSMVLQSMSRLRPFWLFVPFQAALSGTLQWLLAPRYGLYGIFGGLILSFLATVAWGLPLVTLRDARLLRGSVPRSRR